MFNKILRYLKNKFKNHPHKIFDEAIMLDQFQVQVEKPTNRRYTETLLISCVDFRFRNEAEELMSNFLHLEGDYDEIAMPGASLSIVEKKYPEWSIALEEMIELLEGLHHIKRVIFLDHRDCGAYKLIKGKEATSTRARETNTHKQVFKKARKFMNEHFPELKVYTLLMGMDGLVENFKE
ncbi:MAG: hypothetical protein N4A31_06220 [Rickettsiales bacterium]|jgi:hypothetical protein|nr:hypothetical protein [Rickettsiales bacterium]